ncbi:MAG TPA: chromophore lyase CpcT/CpeT [Steroidobacteraceae bacterium]|nr:chromophore lyase CpcT/CpeT [Steroidobacteraceae bacterium]
MDERIRWRGWLARGLFLLACLSVAAWGNKGPKPEEELQELLQWFPGHYDNNAQYQADVRQNVQPPHDALAVDIVPIDAPMIGDHVFYLQESAADDPRRVTAQRIIVFGVVKKDIVETIWSLAEPRRWRDGQRNPDLFKSLMTQDVHSSKGCSLRWHRSEGKFVGADEPKTCHGASGGTGLAHIEYRAELGPEEYALAELAFDNSGHLVRGRRDEPFYRFRKQPRDPEDASSGGE